MTLKERLALQRRRRHEADDAIARLNQRIKTRLIRLAARPALAAYLAREFGLRFTSGWRSVAHNKAVGGVPGSWHTKGTALKPAATDMVGTEEQMAEALAWCQKHIPGLAEAMIHDVGSGRHLHLGGWAVANWQLPKRALLAKWRGKRAAARKRRHDADEQIIQIRREQAAKGRRAAKGIDVSNHQRDVNFASVKHAGYSFAWVKASEGIGFTDPFFLRNVKAARAAGLKVGAYHFLRPQPVRSGVAEARAFHALLKTAGLGKGDLLPVLDVEVTDLDRAATWRYVREALTELRRLTGRRPLFYTYPSFNGGIWPADFDDLARLWIAHYDVAAPHLPPPWRAYAAWQHASDGSVPGVAGDCDVNVTSNLKELIA